VPPKVMSRTMIRGGLGADGLGSVTARQSGASQVLWLLARDIGNCVRGKGGPLGSLDKSAHIPSVRGSKLGDAFRSGTVPSRF
jgi:hypothetical protein